MILNPNDCCEGKGHLAENSTLQAKKIHICENKSLAQKAKNPNTKL